VKEFSRNQILAASVLVSVTLLTTVGLVIKGAMHDRARGGEIRFIEPEGEKSSSVVSGAVQPHTIQIHVVGLVKSPGIYEMKPGSRVHDAVKIAGGALTDADMESINLAERLNDGEQVRIVRKGTNPLPERSGVTGATLVAGGARQETSGKPHQTSQDHHEHVGPQKLKSPGQGKVNINTADLEQLQRLPGIGPAMAQRILDYRSANGRFKAVDELSEVKGIGSSKLENLRPFVSL